MISIQLKPLDGSILLKINLYLKVIPRTGAKHLIFMFKRNFLSGVIAANF